MTRNPYMRKCWICGKEYTFCPVCKSEKSWRARACSTEHYQINQILTERREGVLTDLQAKERFANIGIDENYNLDDILPEVKELIEKNLSAKSKKKKKTEGEQ